MDQKYELHINDNKLTSLPDDFGQNMPQLQFLYLNYNLNLLLVPQTNQLFNFTQFRILSPTIKII